MKCYAIPRLSMSAGEPEQKFKLTLLLATVLYRI